MADDDVQAVAPVAADGKQRAQQWREERDQRYAALCNAARAGYSALAGWDRVTSPEASGRFLIEQLGAERFLEPELMATLWVLRGRLVTELGVQGAAEELLVDCALIAYANTLRVQGWVGNLALLVETEFFGSTGPTAKLRKKCGYGVESFTVEELVERLTLQFLPLLDRCNRMMLRNLRAITELRRSPAPAVAINQATQVNVGTRVSLAAPEGVVSNDKS
jgi:hypothetical protein